MEMETTEPEPDCVVQPPSPPDDFSCQMRLSEKITPLKTCFKKKDQKRLGAGTLRSLRPILNTLLESGSLDGVFRPRNQSAEESSLHESMVKKPLEINASCPPAEDSMSVLIPDGTNVGGQIPEAHPTTDDPEQVVPIQDHSFPPETISGTVADSTAGHFQADLLHPVSSDVPASPDCIDKVMDYVPGVFQDNSFTIQYILDTSDKLNTELFQDKSEEASLDLVFELVNQLQYHTHQENGIEICMDFLQGTCIYGRDCLKHHTILPYHWQIKRTTTQKWQSVSNDSQEHLERFYCNPENDRMRMKYGGQEFWADLNAMNVYETTEFDQLRRLSTPPSSNVNSIYHTVWKFFCRDHFGWREYPEALDAQAQRPWLTGLVAPRHVGSSQTRARTRVPCISRQILNHCATREALPSILYYRSQVLNVSVIRLIEEANSRGLKEVRFMMWNNHYILHNSFFRREIKRRPLFRSCFILLPYLQTLGGVPTQAPQPLEATSSSQIICPDGVTSANFYPETWVYMHPSQDFIQVPVSAEDKSYRIIYNLFHKTVPEFKYRILQILRVQNQFLWEKYKRKKEYMNRKMFGRDRIINERHLFHGTSQDVVDGICKHNFDPRVCGKHATMFGQGSYFAKKASYSHNFSKKSSKGVHFMFLAKVLTGRYTMGSHGMRRPPPVNPGSVTSDLYDSCVDNFFEPQIFVIFNDDQSYPYFVIQYEEVSNTVSI
ncbi:protein mono-ADP-ribosyltransferase TIPARP isoform X1 [Phocoena sinus]|uniref:TCDD inducible poly(ADP-ribose) polymerase n=1 Tax=Phocoena sinus TaxID=42100 RepID=A0A8C9DVR1_PHOSS|nr:protein mono-ADP-ribosyltransferase TIPARP isoform X1 [Phocoena sinus]